MTGKLTTHVLDTARGIPAKGVSIELWQINIPNGERKFLLSTVTNSDGRTDAPLLAGEAFQSCTYELLFAVGEYFREITNPPPFLSAIPVRFTIVDSSSHYHVPLLVSPWSYSTYRGS